MTPPEWRAVEELFLQVSELDEQSRLEILKQQPESLRWEVESLLEADRNRGAFLDAPPALVAASFLESQPDQISEGQQLAGYRIEAMVSVGGMGEVYRALDLSRNQPVAFKLLRRHLIADPVATHRFELEARAAQSLNHQNIVAVYQFGECSAGRFIAMEWVEGVTFRTVFDQGIPPLASAADWSVQAALALAAAHNAEIIHRDIKPENIMLNKDGIVKILDFGLAKFTSSPVNEPESMGASGTISGTLSGTLPYMSPEMFLGENATKASDVFALASVLFELFTGEHPFPGETPLDVLEAIESNSPQPASALRPNLPPVLDELLSARLASEPDRRPSARQVAARLQSISHSFL